MDDFETSKIQKLIRKWKWVMAPLVLISTLVGIHNFARASSQTVISVREAPLHFERWFNQLPEDHWLKDRKYAEELRLFSLHTTYLTQGQLILDQSLEILSQDISSVSDFLLQMFQASREGDQMTPYLVDAQQDKVKAIKLQTGESQEYYFVSENIYPFDVTEEEFQQGIFPVISYVEDPQIVSLIDGIITGIRPGKTNLKILFKGKLYTYSIQVK